MLKSIRRPNQIYTKEVFSLKNEFLKEPLNQAEYFLSMTNELHNLGLRMLQDSLESMNEMLRKTRNGCSTGQ